MIEIPPNEGLYEELKRLQHENYHLKGQLKRKNNEARGRDKFIRNLQKELKEFKKRYQKPHYKNGKRGTQFNG